MTRENMMEKQISRCNRNTLLAVIVVALIFLVGFSWLVFWWPTLLVYLFGIVLLGWALKAALNRRANLYTHPDMKSLNRFGVPLSDVIRDIDSEVRRGVIIYEALGTLVTPNWIIKPSMFGVEVFHNTEFMWIYPDVVVYKGTLWSSRRPAVVVRVFKKRMTSKVITQGANINRQFIDDYSKDQIELFVNEENEQKLLMKIHQHAPWVIVGFDKQTDKLWKSNPSALFTTVKNRQDKMVSQS
jgi:hypothetical protein